jgi:hypothetical protein
VQELVVAPVQGGDDPPRSQHAASHREELIAAPFYNGKGLSQEAEVGPAQRPLVNRALLARISNAVPNPIQERVFAPRLAEDSHAAWPKNPKQFSSCFFQIQVMQDSVAPDAFE